jgi:hypothetical protein
MECPSCKEILKCKFSIETVKEDLPVTITHQWWNCLTCGQKYYGILEESKLNIFDDRLEHEGFYADEKYWNESLKRLKKCPDPKNSKCQCQIHQELTNLEFHGKSAWYPYD